MTNYRRATSGVLLSIVFLGAFSCLIIFSQPFLGDLLESGSEAALMEGVLGAMQNNALVGSINNGQDIVVESSFEILPINARAALSLRSDLYNVDEIIFEKDKELIFPIASLTKLMTAVVVLDKYNLSDIITVGEVADLQSPMMQDVKLGDSMPVESFLELMLVRSSNKAAYSLAEQIEEQNFVSAMNKKAKAIGLKKTFFVDPSGLSDQNVSSAEDLVKLSKYILRNYPRIAKISSQKKVNIPGLGEVENTDELLSEIPGIVFSKTGFTLAADGCLLLVTRDSGSANYLINIVLGAGDRFSEMKKLIRCSEVICE